MATRDQITVLMGAIGVNRERPGAERATFICRIIIDNRPIPASISMEAKKDQILITTEHYPGGNFYDQPIIMHENPQGPHVIPDRLKRLFLSTNGQPPLLTKTGSRLNGRDGVIGKVRFYLEKDLEEEEEEEQFEEFEPVPLPDTLENFEGGGADNSSEYEDEEMGNANEAGTFFDPNYDPNAKPTYSQIQCTPDGYTFTHKK